MCWSEEKREPEKKKSSKWKTTVFSPHSGVQLVRTQGFVKPGLKSEAPWDMHRKETSTHRGQAFSVWQGSLCSKPPELLSSGYPNNVLTSNLKLFFPVCVPFPWSSSLWGDPPSIHRLVLSFLLSVPWVQLPRVPSWAPAVDFHPLSSPWMLLRLTIWWVWLLQEILHLLMAYPPNPILNIWNHFK